MDTEGGTSMTEGEKIWPGGHIEREREAESILADVDATMDRADRAVRSHDSVGPALVQAICWLTRAVVLVAAELTIANRRT